MITRSKSNVIMATNDELELQDNVRLLSEKVAFNDKRFELFEKLLDDNEQYSRRTSLRLNGIPYSGNESAEQSLKKVKDEVFKLGLQNDLVDRDFDRAHRVGSS